MSEEGVGGWTGVARQLRGERVKEGHRKKEAGKRV